MAGELPRKRQLRISVGAWVSGDITIGPEHFNMLI
jgi:hypothetical protein